MRYNFYILFYRSNNPQYIDKLCDPWPNYALHRIAGTNFHQDIEGIQGDISYKCHRLHPRSIHSHIYTNYSQLFCSIRIVNKLHLQNIYHNGQLDTKCSYVSDGNNEKHIHIDQLNDSIPSQNSNHILNNLWLKSNPHNHLGHCRSDTLGLYLQMYLSYMNICLCTVPYLLCCKLDSQRS